MQIQLDRNLPYKKVWKKNTKTCNSNWKQKIKQMVSWGAVLAVQTEEETEEMVTNVETKAARIL